MVDGSASRDSPVLTGVGGTGFKPVVGWNAELANKVAESRWGDGGVGERGGATVSIVAKP